MEDLFDSDFFKKTKFFASSIGQWPYQTRCMRNSIRTIYHVFMLTIIPGMVRAFYFNWSKGKLKAVVLSFPPTFTLFGIFVKYNHYTVNQAETKLLFERLRSDWSLMSTMDRDSRTVFENYVGIAKTIVKYYSIYIFVSLGIFLAAPQFTRILNVIKPLNESRQVRFLFPLDYGRFEEPYRELIMLHSNIVTFMSINIIAACETVYIPLVLPCCGLFAVVRYADYLNGYYSFNFLIMVTMNMIMVSVTGLQLVLQIGELEEIIAAGSYLLAQLLHLFFLSLPGQLLIDCSKAVRTSAYDVPWYNLQPDTQRLLLLVLMRSLRPSTITAGSFFTLEMETFSGVVQTSMSYLTVLASFY